MVLIPNNNRIIILLKILFDYVKFELITVFSDSSVISTLHDIIL